MLAEVIAEVESRFSQRGRAGGRTEPNRFVVGLDEDNATQAWVTALDGQRLLSVQVRSRRRVPRALWPATLRKVNAWNRRQQLTAAWLAVEDWASSDDGAIVIEACLPVSADHDVAQLAEFVDLAVAEGSTFWNIEAIGASRQADDDEPTP